MILTLPKISLRKGREWQLLRGHPWLFSGGISQAPQKIDPGSLVDLIDTNGNFVARGYYNPNCDIAVRILTRTANETVDSLFLKRRIEQAKQIRELLIDNTETNVFRLINAEGDFLPGFIVDSYAGVLVVQSHTAGADLMLPDFIEALKSTMSPIAIILRNDAGVRKREGLTLEAPQVVHGECPTPLIVRENSLQFIIDPIKGQKTGFFTDQRDKRLALAKFVSRLQPGATMLNCFSYTASFSIYAAKANKDLRTINVDKSHQALEWAQQNFKLNDINLNSNSHEFICEDAFTWLEAQSRAQNALDSMFDIIILDPPAFAKTHKEKNKALKGYFRMIQSGLAVLKKNGMAVICSCSGSITMDEFQECIREASVITGRPIQILEAFQHGADHPINSAAPEGNYLKVLFCRVL